MPFSLSDILCTFGRVRRMSVFIATDCFLGQAFPRSPDELPEHAECYAFCNIGAAFCSSPALYVHAHLSQGRYLVCRVSFGIRSIISPLFLSPQIIITYNPNLVKCFYALPSMWKAGRFLISPESAQLLQHRA